MNPVLRYTRLIERLPRVGGKATQNSIYGTNFHSHAASHSSGLWARASHSHTLAVSHSHFRCLSLWDGMIFKDASATVAAHLRQ